MRIIILSVICLFLASCASGTILVTGKTREAIDVEKVTIYIHPDLPEKYENIGKVQASSRKGLLTEQAAQDVAIYELKEQAASVGANGVILTKQGQISNSSGSIAGKTLYFYGAAIYVEKPK